MRRIDREITDRNEILEVMKRCDSCHLALNDTDGYPYSVTLNFGLRASEDEIQLIFHSAGTGHKLDLIAADDRAFFTMDCNHVLQYFPDKKMCTMAYESVAGRGRVRILADAEKKEAMDELMRQYHPDGNAAYSDEVLSRTVLFGLTVESITGKRKKPKA